MATDSADIVVVLTALETEYTAVRELLEAPHPHPHPAGTQFEVGSIRGRSGRVAVAVTGAGNQAAAALAERAITEFRPRAVLFVGIAGALHDDLDLGSVVVATKVYGYHGGIEEDTGFGARPQAWDADHELEQLARVVSRGDTWHSGSAGTHPPPVRFRPIAAGEVVLNSRTTPLAEQLRRHYADAAAIEMESAGSAKAAHLNRSPYLTVRGISDKADGRKHDADGVGWQPIAARNAAAFAIAVAAELLSNERGGSPLPSAVGQGTAQHVIANGGNAYGVINGSMHITDKTAVAAPLTWRPLDEPVEVVWRTGLMDARFIVESCALEVHVIPVGGDGRLEVRTLQHLRDVLPAYGRSHGHFTVTEQLTADVTNQVAWVRSAANRTGPSGMAIFRTGQRTAWSALPHDGLGAVLDPDDLGEQITRLMRLLVEVPDLSRPTGVTLAAGLEPATGLTEDRVGRMPRSQATGLRTARHVRLPPEDLVPFSALLINPDKAADEICARLHMAFRQTR